jgi:hypothetical protein
MLNRDDLQRATASERTHVRSTEIKRLLRQLGHDPASPDWQTAFLDLAAVYLDDERRTASDLWYAMAYLYTVEQKRAAGNLWETRRQGKWDADSDMLLVREVSLLTRQGLSERQAFKQLARAPKKLAWFPYAEQKSTRDRNTSPQSRAAEALRRRFEGIKKTFSDDVLRILQRHLTGERISHTFEQAIADAERRLVKLKRR